MAQNFLPCDDQELLLSPSLREWLPEDRLAWFGLESVVELDLDLFYSAYRSDGWGAAAHDPQMMVAAATHHATRSYEQIAQEILAEAGRIDAAEDELYGEARVDELPEGLRTSGDRRKWLREAKQALAASGQHRPSRFRATEASDSPRARPASSRTGASNGGSSQSTRPGTRAGSSATGRGGWSAPRRTSSPTR